MLFDAKGPFGDNVIKSPARYIYTYDVNYFIRKAKYPFFSSSHCLFCHPARCFCGKCFLLFWLVYSDFNQITWHIILEIRALQSLAKLRERSSRGKHREDARWCRYMIHQCNRSVSRMLSTDNAGSLPCSGWFFFGYSGFPSPQKLTFPISNSTRNGSWRRTPAWMC